jgi:hypothetical protein
MLKLKSSSPKASSLKKLDSHFIKLGVFINRSCLSALTFEVTRWKRRERKISPEVTIPHYELSSTNTESVTRMGCPPLLLHVSIAQTGPMPEATMSTTV